MKVSLKIYFTFIISFLLSHFVAAGQTDKSNRSSGLIISGKTGFSYLVTEIYRDFSGNDTEFNNIPGPFTGVEVSGFFTYNLEAGAGISFAKLKGHSVHTEFSATGFHHVMMEPFSEPVSYDNSLYGSEVFARYYAFQSSSGMMDLFISSGAKIMFNESELFYRNRKDREIIFGKGYGQQKTSIVTNGIFFMGAGLSYSVSDFISVRMSANLNFAGYDFLDVVHNYDEAGNRREVFGMFTDFSAGIAVKLKGKRNFSPKDKRKNNRGNHLPFSPGE